MPEITNENLIRTALSDALEAHIDAVFAEHRLAYIWPDLDTDPTGKTVIFVCKCREGFDGRRKFNEHHKRMLKEVG